MAGDRLIGCQRSQGALPLEGEVHQASTTHAYRGSSRFGHLCGANKLKLCFLKFGSRFVSRFNRLVRKSSAPVYLDMRFIG